MKLRPYQQCATDAVIAEVKQSTEPCLIDAAPAAGKSFMVADLAARLHEMSGGKRVLCLAPSKELTRQNYAKFLLTGAKASIFSASAGQKSTRRPIVFGTAGTVKNSISRFCKAGQAGYCAVLIDECHGITPTIKSIIETMLEANLNLRVIGLTGTPYRLGTGYIFRQWPTGKNNSDDTCRDPYFTKCVYSVNARQMLEQGFITPMRIGEINSTAYDASGLTLLPNGKFDSGEVDRAFVGHGRKTAAIVGDVLHQAQGIKGGVMFFAATVRHAEEIMASLPPDSARLVTGDPKKTTPKERDKAVDDYRHQRARYIVSVGTLTTGFDVEHTAIIALLRATESAALLQQIMGRAWRLHPDKPESILLDYAENVERHFPDGDIYAPVIKAGNPKGGGELMDAECPDCHQINEFTIHPDYAEFSHDKHGYCLDIFGNQVMTEHGPTPKHYGRRCFGQLAMPGGKYERCGYRWTGKDCPHCDEKNDIAARYCYVCKGEIVDPNERLAAEFKATKRDPTRPQTDKVLSFTTKEGVSRAGNPTLRVDWVTPYRQFSTWFQPQGTHPRARAEYAKFIAAGDPETVSYAKDRDSGFFRVLAYDQPVDVLEIV